MATSTVDSLSHYNEFTEHDVFQFTQNSTVMFWSFGFETASKLWLRNFHDLVIFPVRHCERQQTLRPQWIWPWINVRRDLRLLQGFVLSPADHFAHSIVLLGGISSCEDLSGQIYLCPMPTTSGTSTYYATSGRSCLSGFSLNILGG